MSITQLREIAQQKWDAVYTSGRVEEPTDRYDRYIVTAAVRLWNGDSNDDVADYLVDAETDRLGLDTGAGMRERALELTSHIRRYLDSLPTDTDRETRVRAASHSAHGTNRLS